MFDKECIYCTKVLECKGKEKPTPCLHFENRKDDKHDSEQPTKRRTL